MLQFMNVAALIVLFLIRLRFPQSKSGKGNQQKAWTRTVKKLRKLEKLVYKLWKAQIDIEFLSDSSRICTHNHLVPK